ncbi:hypothetical protein B4123_2164 [Bacillus paralicheniformis]|nr:hypothetical protein B4125_0519 [Bacillus paralicheniformis]TWJ46621.1 hypothetical protein CHCC5025_0003 [Bacillus licheniformis]OLG11449.1 hypothetical protein B4123_2164 [Bacillus paralicheniformis]TWK15297.1 hypothetical protein CHCC20373_2108 [Bacillus licheniformis]TWK31286.1 hypothetical protein CHCC20369_3857 [Bacillus licheniformis]
MQKNFRRFFLYYGQPYIKFFYNKITNTKGKKKMSKIRSTLYKPEKIFRDVNAVKNGTIGKCIARRAAGKTTGKLLGKLFK